MKSTMRTTTSVLFAIALLLFWVVTMAQTSTTGTIEGSVVDSNGGAVPGITVTVSSPNLIRPQTSTTNQEGYYNILNLPPGRYTLTVESAKGFSKYEKSDIDVGISKSSTVPVTLQAASVGASVDIAATSGATIDTTSNTAGTAVSTDQFSNFPTTRTVQGLYTIAPTTTRSGLRDSSGRERDPSVAGSSGPENNYILDGVDTTDPAFGGSGANLPFEFVQEVEVKTGAFGAEYGHATGGIFNVITKSGGNDFHGDIFGYFTTKGLVRAVKNLPFTGSAANGFSEADVGGDIGGRIIKDKLWFFGAFNPQTRKNYYLTQTFHDEVNNKVTTPFYAGKLTWGINTNNTLTFSTFGDFTKVTGFLASGLGTNVLTNVAGFGSDPTAFTGTEQTGGQNYALRLNSTVTPRFIAEVSGGLHFQRANIIPTSSTDPQVLDNFAVLGANNQVVTVTQTGIPFTPDPSNPSDQSENTIGLLDFAFSPGGTLQRNFSRGPGFGLFQNQKRDRYEAAGRFQYILNNHAIKFGVEFSRNKYVIDQLSSGPSRTFPNPFDLPFDNGTDINQVNGYRINNNNFSVCATRGGTTIVCPSASAFAVANQLLTLNKLPAGFTAVENGTVTAAETNTNPFLVRLSTRVRDFQLHGKTHTNVESFYLQDDYKVYSNFQLNLGFRWDYQQAYANDGSQYIRLNNFIRNAQPRLGFTWDPTKKGLGKIFMNYARFVEVPIPLDVNIRGGAGGGVQTDKQFNVNAYSAPAGSFIVPGVVPTNFGAATTPVDPGLHPATVNEVTAGGEYEVIKDLVVGIRGVYRNQGSVIEDGSFDNGTTYFIFNPGERRPGSTEDIACNDPTVGCFGRARRYYRALEFTATKRFSRNYQFIASYVHSSLIGNFEGLFRNDNGQADPNVTSLFDLVRLLTNTFGRLPNDRPNQFKFNGSYQTPWKLMVSGNFYAQSGVPFNALIPDVSYGNNEGFAVPRGTAIIPNVGASIPGGSNGVQTAVGKNRSPFTTNLDLGLYYPFAFSESKQLRFQFDWFNVFNAQRAVSMDQTFTLNSGVTGVAPIANPFWGAGQIFQFPSAIRLGVKFQF